MNNDDTTYISVIKDAVTQFIQERKWEKYHNPKDLALSICVEAGELAEVFQWISDEISQRIELNSDQGKHLQEELSDVLIYCFSLAINMNIDITSAVLAKIKKNSEKYPVEKVKGNYHKPNS